MDGLKYARRTALGLLLAATSALAAGACSSDDAAPNKGQLVVVIKTDMQVPKDVSAVRLEVVAGGVVRHRDIYFLGADGSHLKLPGTLTLVAGRDPSIPVKIRVIAYSGNVPKVLRETITTVPPDRVAMLPMAVSWLCWDEPTPAPPPEGQNLPDANTSCQEGSACVAGSCVASEITADELEDYTPENVFGGAAAPGEAGTCFDTLACFEGGSLAPVDLASCSVAAPAATEPLNVALVLQPGGQGICNDSTCLIALDRDQREGWQLNDSGRVVLPSKVCDQILDGEVIGIALSSDCVTKTAAIPTCGPWSSVTSLSGTFDGGASFDASNPCWTSGSGTFCGSVLGADPLTLYTCQDGVPTGQTTCSGSCVESDAGDDFCAGTAGLGQTCTTTGDCQAGLTCLTADSGAIGGEGPANGICTRECTDDPTVCDELSTSGFAAPCVELGARDFCLESCNMGGGATGKCQSRVDVACAPVSLVGGTAATTCLPTCASDADCGGSLRCNFATGLCTTTAATGSGALLDDCALPDAGASVCQSGFCYEYSDPMLQDAGGDGAFGHCSARCRMGTPGACGFNGPVDGGQGAIAACVTPAGGAISEGDLGFCGGLCEVGCSSVGAFCTTSASVCKPFNDPSLEAKYGTSGYCVPYWEYSGGGC